MSLLALQFNPHKCPCCWDVQGTNLSDWDTLIYSAATGPCHAFCMPFVSDAPGWLAFDGLTCRTQESLSGISGPSFTPCRSTTWLESISDVYWSKILTNGTCQAQYAQYCTIDEAGNRGRAWVVELWIKDGVGGITNFNTKVLDWQCKCSGWDGGAGARFEWTLDIEVPASCEPVVDPDCPCVSDPPPSCLRVTVPAFTLHNTLYGDCSYAGGTYDLAYTPAFGCYWEFGNSEIGIGLIYNPAGHPSVCGGDTSKKWAIDITIKSICSSTPNCRLVFCSTTCTGVFTYSFSCYEFGSGQTGGPPASVTVATC